MANNKVNAIDKYNVKDKYNFSNTYLELNNDNNYIIINKHSTYCNKCGKKLDKNSLDRFCDSECRMEYYSELKHDIKGFEY